MLFRALLPLLLLATQAAAQDIRQLDVDGYPRDYLHYRPADAPPGEALPALLVLPPAAMAREITFQRHHLKAVADAERVVILIPPARLRNPRLPPHTRNNQQLWNDGSAWTRETMSGSDDVAYLDTVLDDALAKGGIDRTRIMVAGWSMGGSMALRYANERPTRVAAVGSVAGHFWGEAKSTLPVLVIAGADDPLWPPDGAPGKPAMRAEPARWADLAGCAAPTESRPAEKVTRLDWRGCRDNVAVSFILVAGLGHQWPGGEPTKAPHLGPYSAAIDAGREMVAFLRAHGRPPAAPAENKAGR